VDAALDFQHWIPPRLLESGRLDARFYGPEHIALLSKLDQTGIATAPLGELVTHLAHVTGYESTKHMEFVDDPTGVKVVEAMNVGDLLIDPTEWKRISRDGYEGVPRHQLAEEDLVFSKDGTLGNCAIVSFSVLPAVASRHVFRIVPRRKRVDPCYLAALLSSSVGRTQTTYRQAGAIQGTIITPEVSAFRIVLPSDQIQRAIGNKVRKAERLRELAEGELSEMSRLLESLGLHWSNRQTRRVAIDSHNWVPPLFIDPRLDCNYYSRSALDALKALKEAEARGCVDLRRLSQCATRIMDFQAFSVYNEVEFAEEYRSGWLEFIRVVDLRSLLVDTEAVLWTSPKSHQIMPKSVVHPGDVLLSIIGTLGVASIWPENARLCNSNQCIAKITPQADIDAYYLAVVLNSQEMQALIDREATGTIQRGVTLTGTRNLLVPICESAKQESISRVARNYVAHLRLSKSLVTGAKTAVEALVDGTLDEERLLAESAEIEAWRKKNPSPREGSSLQARPEEDGDS
jgi:hypothetical protein